MVTPQHFKENLDNNIITYEMLAEVLRSLNKRAKNFRDEANKKDFQYNRNKMNYYYNDKRYLLEKFCYPIQIHRQPLNYKRCRVFDYNRDYYELYDKYEKDIVWENKFLDEDRGEVYFFDYIDKNQNSYLYFLYYEVNGRGFHSNIEYDNVKNYNLPIVDLNSDFLTVGDNEDNLLSKNFIKKFMKLAKSDSYQIKR